MNFDFTEEQRLLRDSARRFLAEGAAAARRILEADEAFDRELWAGMAELGWLGAAVPERLGGAGLGYVELAVIAEELGRSLAPTPFSSSVYLASEALLLAGSAEQKERYLPALAQGQAIATLALAEGTGPVTPGSIRATVRGGRISGCKRPVPDGDVADFAVVAAREGESEASVSLYLVELAEAGVRRRALRTIDPSRSHGELEFDDAVAEPLGRAGEGWSLLGEVRNRAAILFAFEQLGGAEAALEMATGYAKERFAFGRPIGSFQAIKHKLADVYIGNEIARSNCYFAIWALQTGAPELAAAAAAARVAASGAFNLAAAENIQVHGGMGFTWEFDCHLYHRRAKLLALNLGGERVWKDRLVSILETQNAA